MIIGINICGVITIMCDTNTINVTFYLLKVLHAQKKKKKYGYCRIIQKIEGEHFIKSNYFLYFIPNNFFWKYLRVGIWPYVGSAHVSIPSICDSTNPWSVETIYCENYQAFFRLESYLCAVIYCKIDTSRNLLNTSVVHLM